MLSTSTDSFWSGKEFKTNFIPNSFGSSVTAEMQDFPPHPLSQHFFIVSLHWVSVSQSLGHSSVAVLYGGKGQYWIGSIVQKEEVICLCWNVMPF